MALLAHPDDQRYAELVGGQALTPLFHTRVPVLAHHLVEPDKGTGLVMVCTFGDLTDVTWWRELSLPVRAVLGEDGRLRDVPWGEPGWETEHPDRAHAAYEHLRGLTVNQARRQIVQLLTDSGDLLGEPTPVTRAVKFFEKGERPVEIVTSRQWFVRTVEHRDALIARGRELRWHPPYMRARYEDWVNGLTGDWCISRQRFFGVPFPVWYPLDQHAAIRYDQPILAAPDRLPVDPSSDLPPGYTPDQRDQPGGFTGDPDVMDTWATSSLTPQIASADGFERPLPMDMRPQAHDIIRTWLFTTVLRAHLDHDTLPWTTAAISGWVLDPDRKKMSKSRGNVVTPMHLLAEHGSDAVRYWAASGRPGVDTAFDPQQMRVGRRLAVKLLNASKFALAGLPPAGPRLANALDRAMIARLAALVQDATAAFDDYDYARALQRTEDLFWWFCDNYLELVKGRRYQPPDSPGAASVSRALRLSASTFQRLFAPFLPFACEEVWSWWQPGSIHRAPWPQPAELTGELDQNGAPDSPEQQALSAAVDVLAEVRRAKSEAKRPMRAPVTLVRVHDLPARLQALELGLPDLLDAGVISQLQRAEADTFAVDITLAPA